MGTLAMMIDDIGFVPSRYDPASLALARMV
jgi:hypothetical protein